MNKTKEKITSMKKSEMEKYLNEARLKLASLKLDWQAGKLSRYSEIIKEKKKIARSLTAARQQQLKELEK